MCRHFMWIFTCPGRDGWTLVTANKEMEKEQDSEIQSESSRGIRVWKFYVMVNATGIAEQRNEKFAFALHKNLFLHLPHCASKIGSGQ